MGPARSTHSSRAHLAFMSTAAAAHSIWRNIAANIHRLVRTHVLTFWFRAPSYRYNLNKHVEQTHVSRVICECDHRPQACLFLSLRLLEIQKKVEIAVNSAVPPAQALSLPSVRTDLVWQWLCSLTFSTHIGLISSQNGNGNPAAVRSGAPSLWPLLHSTWNPIKAMKSNQRRLHLVMLISHLLAIKSNSSPKLFIYLFPSRACSVALYVYPPPTPPATPSSPPPRPRGRRCGKSFGKAMSFFY